MQLLCKKPGLITLNDGVARALSSGKVRIAFREW
jgi:hypothetical protein